MRNLDSSTQYYIKLIECHLSVVNCLSLWFLNNFTNLKQTCCDNSIHFHKKRIELLQKLYNLPESIFVTLLYLRWNTWNYFWELFWHLSGFKKFYKLFWIFFWLLFDSFWYFWSIIGTFGRILIMLCSDSKMFFFSFHVGDKLVFRFFIKISFEFLLKAVNLWILIR